MSVTSPIFFPLPACDPVVVFDELLLPLPPQPATKSARRPRNTSDLFIPTLSDKVCDYGAKTVSELSNAHPTPAHVSLAVVLQVRAGRLQVLLWERAHEPFAGSWSLPGGYLVPGETLEQSIRRQLADKVDVRELAHLEQLETRSEPRRSPDEWQLATAYLGLVPSGADPRVPGDTGWHAVDSLPTLAFDHEQIVLAGRERLRAKLSYTNIGFALAPEQFTISELRDVYAAALGHDISATNLQRVLLRRGVLESTGALRASGPAGGRPGALFRFRARALEVTDQFAVLRPPAGAVRGALLRS
jgi:ADP-ribose pyrophosphatase YjhB (NUDIX family)